MRISEVDVWLVVCVSVCISGTSFILAASDNPQKELTIRSIDANPKSVGEQPVRVNLTSIALNVLPIDTKDSLEDKLSNGGVVNAKEVSLTGIGGAGGGGDVSNIGSIINDDESVIGSLSGGIVTTGDVIESQTSKNIQAAGKLTTTPSPKLRKEKSDPYECPNTSEFSFFPHYCSRHANCLSIGKEYRCCRQFNSKRCVKGVPKPLKEQRHEPILGLIPRKCPKEPLAELFWELKTCNTDHDCWPRICCPDGLNKYCRTSRPELDSLPVGKQLAYPIDMLSSYLQCTPAPPTAYDLHPKPCNNTLDCFPNVCCQEAGKKYCRPPKRSLLAFLTTFAQRFNTGPIRQWTDNIVFNR